MNSPSIPLRFPAKLSRLLVVMLCLALLAACQTAGIGPVPDPAGTSGPASNAPGAESGPDDAPAPGANAPLTFLPVLRSSDPPVRVFLDAALPAGLVERLLAAPQEVAAGYVFTSTQSVDGLRLGVGGDAQAGYWVYALVAPFPSLDGGVSLAELQQAWQGQASLSQSGALLMSADTLRVLSAWWGEPAQNVVRTAPAGELVDLAWQDPSSRAVIPFEEIQPRWKVLELDGRSPLRRDFDPAGYGLAVPVGFFEPVGFAKPADAAQGLAAALSGRLTNRDPQKLTTLAMTGVTALVRATAATMESRGITYPGRDIGDILRGADLTHISNEVAFAEDCPAPNAYQEGVVFCSRDSYFDLLADVGTDIVELSGDHFQDWGTQAVYHTLDLYNQAGWRYYGGGQNLDDGRKALLVEDHGNKLAFIGCNAKGAAFAHASADNPGAVTCDFDWMEQEITRLRGEGYLPVATFQHFEYYTYAAQPNQVEDFGRLARAGAVIVSGSQAHQPQGMAFEDSLGASAFLHYGLGNLFFDQYDLSIPCRQAFIDRHIFYNGQYLGVELIPILFEDYARARPMNRPEADDLLRSVFAASGW